MPTAVQIRPISPAERPQALDLLWHSHDPAARETLTRACERESIDFAGYWGALLGAFRTERLVGATWSQPQPGRTAAMHGPIIVDGEPAATARQLAAETVRIAERQGVELIQSLCRAGQSSEIDALLAAGFNHVADLLYMFCDSRSFPTALPATQLHFEPYSEQSHARLAAVLQQTYAGSLDCPQVDGIRSIDAVLAGYRATGVFDERRWLIATASLANDAPPSDVGCLLLADHPATEQFELVYMGVTPQVRGQGWGVEIVRQAQWLASRANRPRLVLAVDAANIPAVDMYAAAGFIEWDRRSALVRTTKTAAS